MVEEKDLTEHVRTLMIGGIQGNEAPLHRFLLAYRKVKLDSYTNEERTDFQLFSNYYILTSLITDLCPIGNPTAEQLATEEVLTVERGVDIILERYSSREDWRQASVQELEDIEAVVEQILGQARECIDLHQGVALTLAVRQTLINNEYGNVTRAMVENQDDWQDFLARIGATNPSIRVAMNWLHLLIGEWHRRQAALPVFWDLMVNLGTCDEKALQATVSEIVLLLFPREAFIAKRYAKVRPVLEVLFEYPPIWMTWNAVPVEQTQENAN